MAYYPNLILVAGDTGLAWRIDIAEQLAAWWGVRRDSGGVRRAFKRGVDNGLIEMRRPAQEIVAWRPGYLVRLTAQGREAFRFLRGEDPNPSQLSELMRRHKTLEHVALNLKIAEVLWQVGYNSIEIFPDTVPVGDGRVYYPDLKVEKDGRNIYVECERQIEGKQSKLLAKKLDLYRLAAGDSMYFATPSEKEMEALRNLILASVGSVDLHMTSVERCEEVQGEVWVRD